MKFVEIPQQNGRDFLLINLARITYISANDKSGTCKVWLAGSETITLFPPHSTQLFNEISNYNRQVTIHLTGNDTDGDW